MKRFTPKELADLIIEYKSHRVINFYGGKLPRNDHKTGVNYVDHEVIHLSERGGGMRGTSFCSSEYYNEGELQTIHNLPSREKLISDIKSNGGFYGSEVFMVNEDKRTRIGIVPSSYKRNGK